MKYRTLGRTGLRVSELGLGGGGKSCLGVKSGKTEAESVRIVERAIDLGINLIDTSGRNGTEGIIGRAVGRHDRSRLVLSTKALVSEGNSLKTAAQFSRSMDCSLRDLGTNYVDIMHVYGVLPDEYDYAVTELLPVMQKFQAAGKVRFIGITEHFDQDRNHTLLQRALADDYWDVMMVGFNMINQSARKLVFPTARAKDIGILGMFAVRRAIVSLESFSGSLQALKAEGQLSHECDIEQLIEQLTGKGKNRRPLTEIAYRYCRDEPAVHSVLAGTGEIRHLQHNCKAFDEPPLAQEAKDFIAETFGRVHDFSGN